MLTPQLMVSSALGYRDTEIQRANPHCPHHPGAQQSMDTSTHPTLTMRGAPCEVFGSRTRELMDSRTVPPYEKIAGS